MNYQSVKLILFFASIVAVSMTNNLTVLSTFFVLFVLFANRDLLWVFKRILIFALPFTFIVYASFALIYYIDTATLPQGIAQAVLRITLMSGMSFLIPKRIDIIFALRFSKSLQRIVIITLVQTTQLKSFVQHAHLALKSRTPLPITVVNAWRFYAVLFSRIFEMLMHKIITHIQAVRSRGGI